MSNESGFYYDETFPAGADLSSYQYYAVNLNSSGQVVLAVAGEPILGVLQNAPAAANRAAAVRIFGKTKWKTASAMTPGALVASDAAGKATTATKGKVDTSDGGAAADPVIGSNVAGRYCGTAASVSGDFSEVLLLPMGIAANTLA